MIDQDSTLIDIAFATCTALDRSGIVAILCGGSAATFYTRLYQSLDADFVLQFETSGREVDAALGPTGFTRGRNGIYAHPSTRFTVEFPAGPLSVGRKIVKSWHTARRERDLLHVISPEDCVSDRFLHYWAWRDKSARTVALAVAGAVADLDIGVIEAWAAEEMANDIFYDASAWNVFRGDLLATRNFA